MCRKGGSLAPIMETQWEATQGLCLHLSPWLPLNHMGKLVLLSNPQKILCASDPGGWGSKGWNRKTNFKVRQTCFGVPTAAQSLWGFGQVPFLLELKTHLRTERGRLLRAQNNSWDNLGKAPCMVLVLGVYLNTGGRRMATEEEYAHILAALSTWVLLQWDDMTA